MLRDLGADLPEQCFILYVPSEDKHIAETHEGGKFLVFFHTQDHAHDYIRVLKLAQHYSAITVHRMCFDSLRTLARSKPGVKGLVDVKNSTPLKTAFYYV